MLNTILPKGRQSTDWSTVKSPVVKATRQLTWFERIGRRKLVRWLGDLDHDAICFNDLTNGETVFGGDSREFLQADWAIVDPQFYGRLATDGSIGIAESYLRGEWHTEDLTSLLRIFCRDLHRMQTADSGLVSIGRLARRLLRRSEKNTRSGSRRHIAAHYDLSNDFFELFLDPSLMYSSAYFEHSDMTLHEASIAKLEKICRKLHLKASDQVLEIGTGWGGFALHTAKNFDCRLTTTTISSAQYKKAQERFRKANIDRRVTLLNDDYRDLNGKFDKLVSIEMLEAVGERYLDNYFQQCGRLLQPGGRLVMQTIVMPEQRYQSYRHSVDFIRKYIFPGGFLPSVSAIQESVGKTSNLRLQSLEDISPHYAKTLHGWRQRFLERLNQVRALGFDDRFIRMWEYYLCYCEAAFREQAVRVVQMVWDKPKC